MAELTENQRDIKEIKETVKSIHDKLFVGNGQPPIIIQIDRLNTFKKVSVWFLGVSVIASLSLVVRLLYLVIIK